MPEANARSTVMVLKHCVDAGTCYHNSPVILIELPYDFLLRLIEIELYLLNH